jgi:hypothetical protein
MGIHPLDGNTSSGELPSCVMCHKKFVKIMIHFHKGRNQRKKEKPRLTFVIAWWGLGLKETRLFGVPQQICSILGGS